MGQVRKDARDAVPKTQQGIRQTGMNGSATDAVHLRLPGLKDCPEEDHLVIYPRQPIDP